MRGRAEFFLDGLVALDTFEPADRRGVFRQSIAELARAASRSEGPSPLERLDPAELGRSVDVALTAGLFEDLDWLAPEDAALALYELASAVPLGNARREIGRRVLSLLYEGAAPTFVALATRMANGSARGLTGAGIRARVALSIGAPPHLGVVAADPLAYALVTRRELSADWLAGATGSLPERRLTGRLFERAAREAAWRARNGDASALDPFAAAIGASSTPHQSREGSTEALPRAWHALLADRETLVWRHVASARGLLCEVVPHMGDEIANDLSPELTPTEWRRAATSLVASFAVTPEASLARAIGVLEGPLVERDPGVVIAMMWGVPRAADAEPEACEELLERIAATHALYTAEALVALRGECGRIGDAAAIVTADAVRGALGASSDEEIDALARGILGELEGEPQSDLATSLEQSVAAFLEQGTREARTRAQRALGDAATLVASIEMVPVDKHGTPIAGRRGQAATQLRALDRHVLESSELKSLLLLDRAASQVAAGVGALDDLDERLAKWLIRCESNAQPLDEPPAHAALRQRQLRALLHLIDGETSDFENEGDRRSRVQARWSRVSRLLLARLNEEGSSPFRRSVTATLARALDALVRDGAADAVDVLLYAASHVVIASDLEVLAEASMHPEVSRLLDAYGRFERVVVDAAEEQGLAALDALAAELRGGMSQRTDGLRGTLVRLSRALAGIASLETVALLGDMDASPLVALEDALARLTQLTQTARRRIGDDVHGESTQGSGAHPLAVSLGHALMSGADPATALEPYVTATLAATGRALPRPFARLVAVVLPRVASLPAAAPAPRVSIAPVKRSGPPPSKRDARLPTWMPTRRTLGGFYVLRPLGQGGSGTVFVVTRAEERHDASAERFALKVPQYDANAARSLSEAAFLRLFRQEASALLAVPEHENLARFVTFDAGAKPKPILVMELVEGTSLDDVLAARALTVSRATAILDGVLAGLAAMHGVGVGHLDLKPSNVILRGDDEETPVLVDFGLAGRHVRPGCGTGNYVAPEVWVETEEGTSPLPVDVYAFACVAYELFTGETLFEAPNEVALISAHLTHDGLPPGIKRLAQHPSANGLAMLLHSCLRRQASRRLGVTALRAELARVGRDLAGQHWPL